MSKKLLANVGNTVVDNYRRYYQEYEGTFITATDKSEDDTLDTSRYIEVTEIWGNTVQDENNLEDIQSVGELYVDDEENPILDELGREQYKIEISSCNDNINTSSLILGWLDNNGNVSPSHSDLVTPDFVYVKKNSTIWLKLKNNNSNFFVCEYDCNYNFIKKSFVIMNTHPCYGLSENTTFIKVMIQINSDIEEKLQISYYYNGSYFDRCENKTTILLPCQLQKVGDVYDRLYWDSGKGKYVVEKNISKKTLVKTCDWWNQAETDEFITKYVLDSLYSNAQSSDVICTTLPTITTYNATQKGICGRNAVFYVSLPKSELTSFDSNGFNAWLTENPSYFYYKFKTPQLIETNITEKIQLPCYKEKTHIFVNSTVDATMKVLVPYKEII